MNWLRKLLGFEDHPVRQRSDERARDRELEEAAARRRQLLQRMADLGIEADIMIRRDGG